MATTEEQKTVNDDALMMVYLRNTFYKNKYHYMVGVYFLSFVVVCILFVMLIYLLRHPIHPLYFAADQAGRLIQDIPVREPNMSNDQVAAWAVQATEAAYTYNFVNYRAQLQETQKFFTDYGWKNYLQALKASNNLIALTERRYIFIAKAAGQPKLIAQGPLGNLGALAWKFEIPLLVTYMRPPYDDKSRFQNPLLVSIVVQRQKILESYQGLGVVQLIGNFVLAPTSSTMTPT